MPRRKMADAAAIACTKAASIAAVLAFAATFATAHADNKPDPTRLLPGPAVVTTDRITNFARIGGGTHFGTLEFLGGLVLKSPSANFGGWSGLAVGADGASFLAVSDAGLWLTGSITYAGTAPAGIEDARMGPLLALDGKPIKRPRDRDAEAVALLSAKPDDGLILISFEQNARIARYQMKDGRSSPTLGFLDKPTAARTMRRNGGYEALTVMKGGRFKGCAVAIAERLYDRKRNHTGWLWTARGAEPFTLTNIGDFDITDVASADDGTLYVLERRFRWLEGIKMRIRRIAPGDVAPGKILSGEILIEANLEQEIDNMEGLAVTRTPSGDTLLTLISDDNFNRFLQRTVLLQFALAGDGTAHTAKTRPQN